MTAPTTLSMPKIDHESLEKAIAKANQNAVGDQFYSRAQVRLEAAQAEAKALEAQQRDVRTEIARTQASIAGLTGVLEQQKANEADITVELLGQLNLIDTLRKAGVTL